MPVSHTAVLPIVLVVGAQFGLYAVLPAWALGRACWRDTGEWLFAALMAGVASAALLGRACNGSGIGADVALGAWLVAWLCAGALARRRALARARRWDWTLLAVLVLACVVRSIHPMQTWALGQSDAYSHLGFLIDVLERGKVGNVDYPPAHAWVMAFPAWLSGQHPYWTARFGGAFFGVGLALGAYALTSQWKGRSAGLAAAALVAGCPLLWLLEKTGVGSFANQLGLLLIPATLWAFSSKRYGWLAFALAALAVSVPMLLLHVLLLLALWTVSERRGGRARLGVLALLALTTVGLLALTLQIPPARGMVIASLLTGQHAVATQGDVGWVDVLRILAADFVSAKRWGYGSWTLNVTALGIAALFAAALASGFRRNVAAWRLTGLWGLLTSANVHIGFLQFTDYQREGWSFLLCLACLGGLLFDALWRRRLHRRWRVPLAAGIVAGSLAGLAVPPAHVALNGPAESDMVRVLLALDPGATVLARRTSLFVGGQGDIARTLHPNTIHEAADLGTFEGPVLFLRDHPPSEPELSPVMRRLQPRQLLEIERFCAQAEEANRRLEAELAGIPKRVQKVSDHLDVWWLRPAGQTSAPRLDYYRAEALRVAVDYRHACSAQDDLADPRFQRGGEHPPPL